MWRIKHSALPLVASVYRRFGWPQKFNGMEAARAHGADKSTVGQLMLEHQGLSTQKWLNYLEVYSAEFAALKQRRGDTGIRILEIGVNRGGFLQILSNYFGPESTIIGVDINPSCREISGRNYEVRVGSQANKHFLKGIAEDLGEIDLVIDDGSHRPRDQKRSLEVIFPYVSDGGLYLVEDTHTSYILYYLGFWRLPTTFIAYAKRAVDYLHGDFVRFGPRSKYRRLWKDLYSVHFYNSIVVFSKRSNQKPPEHFTFGSS